jgi:signal transduction histidine kinase
MRIEPSSQANAIAIFQEITENKRLEEQLHNSQRSEIIGRLAIGLAHDFNNLLMIISGYCHLLLANLPEKTSSHSQVRAISRASERASTLSRQLLNFGRNVKLSPQILDLNQVVSGTDKLLALLAGEQFRLETSLAPDLNYIKIDKSEIERVLMNLIINARDAMPQGGDIIVETTNVFLDEGFAFKHKNLSAGNYVMLSVRDNGEGIDEENLSRIFEPYFTTKGHRRGVGLGLSTVVDIVKQNKGHISVESKPGSGTAFRIYLPQARLHGAMAAPHSLDDANTAPQWMRPSLKVALPVAKEDYE